MNTMTVQAANGLEVVMNLPIDPARMRDEAHNARLSVTRPATIEACTQAVAAAYGMSESDLHMSLRGRAVSHPRQMVWLLARAVTGKSYPDIASAFGAHHSTVIYGIEGCIERIERSEALTKTYSALLLEFPDKYPAPMPGKWRKGTKKVMNARRWESFAASEPAAASPKATKRKCSCGTTFKTTEDYRFCHPCREKMAQIV